MSLRGRCLGRHRRLYESLALDPRNVTLLLRRARTYEAKNDDAAARLDYDRAVEFAPKNPEVLVARARFFKRRVRSEQALADLVKAIEVAPDYLPAYDERASFYALRGKHRLAADDLTKVLSARPHDTGVLRRRMDAFLELRDSDRAIADGTKLVTAMGGHDALLARGIAYLQKGGPALDLAQPDLEAGVRILRNADNAGLRFVRAICETLFARQRPTLLLKTIVVGLWRMQVDALGLSAHSKTRRHMIADADAHLGLLALKRNDLKTAASIFDAALALSTESATALYGRGVVKHQAGDIEGAKDDFVAARALHPGIDHAFAVIGIEPVPETRIVMVAPMPESGIERDIALCDGKEMTSRADGSIDFVPNIEGCTRTLRGTIAKPAKARAYYMRAQWLASTGDVAAAAIDVDAALAIEPRNADALLARAALLVRARRFEHAIADFDLALKIAPESFQALFGRCWARIETRDVKGAVQDCDRAVELSRDPDVFIQRRAPILLRAGQYERARADYDRILRHIARQGLEAAPHILFGRGIARRKLGDTGGDDDLKAARKQQPGIDKEFAALGLTP